MIARVAALVLILAAASPARAESPQNLYTLNCWGCHRADGEGIPGTAPPLRNAADFLKVPGGRQYLIQVPGVSLSPLDDLETASVMNWIIATFSKDNVPADFKPYTAEEIREVRRKPHLLDVTGTRRALMEKMAAMGIRPLDAATRRGAAGTPAGNQ
jgi:mono/diheme cytochrome c family protein